MNEEVGSMKLIESVVVFVCKRDESDTLDKWIGRSNRQSPRRRTKGSPQKH